MQIFLKILKFLAPYLLKWVERGIIETFKWYRKNHPDFNKRVDDAQRQAAKNAGSLATRANVWVRSLMERTRETANRAKEKVARKPAESVRREKPKKKEEPTKGEPPKTDVPPPKPPETRKREAPERMTGYAARLAKMLQNEREERDSKKT